MRRLLAAAVVLLLGVAARAAAVEDLYVARAFVTGQGEVNRAAAFVSTLAEVLVKVSGDPRLFADQHAAFTGSFELGPWRIATAVLD